MRTALQLAHIMVVIAACSDRPVDPCTADLAAQARYLEQEQHSAQHTFEKYQVPVSSRIGPAGLDVNSSRYTHEFRTRIREQLDRTGINFAGHYSVIAVGMTGWGANYWIVDRQSGRAREFPYFAAALDFRPDSYLLVMNAPDSIRALLSAAEGCYFLHQQNVSDLRPFYFTWQNDTLSLVAPADIDPPVNAFWLDYLSEIPDSTRPHIAHFIRKVREGVIRHLDRVPQEGYYGFMIADAFPAIRPQDFLGITTRGGQYEVRGGRLYFSGHGSSDAPVIDAAGMTVLLQNIERRLGIAIQDTVDVNRVLTN